MPPIPTVLGRSVIRMRSGPGRAARRAMRTPNHLVLAYRGRNGRRSGPGGPGCPNRASGRSGRLRRLIGPMAMTSSTTAGGCRSWLAWWRSSSLVPWPPQSGGSSDRTRVAARLLRCQRPRPPRHPPRFRQPPSHRPVLSRRRVAARRTACRCRRWSGCPSRPHGMCSISSGSAIGCGSGCRINRSVPYSKPIRRPVRRLPRASWSPWSSPKRRTRLPARPDRSRTSPVHSAPASRRLRW